MKQSIPRLHVITDETLQSQYSHAQLARICVDAGTDGVQYREKRDRTLAERIQTAVRMLQICDESGATLIVNDFVDVAIQSDATAIHLGRTDEAVPSARMMIPESTVIGGTANSFEEALQVAKLEVDYVGVGPVFGTTSKASPAPPLGIATLSKICEAIDKPVVAIGNIRLENATEVIEAGAYGLAVLSAICCAPDVGKATRGFCEILGL